MDDSPTIFSFQDTITMIEMKFGKNWMNNQSAKRLAVWNSSLFERDHIKEICQNYQGLHELCEEYYKFETIDNVPLPEIFFYQVLEFMQNLCRPPELISFQAASVSDAYWLMSEKNEPNEIDEYCPVCKNELVACVCKTVTQPSDTNPSERSLQNLNGD